MRAGTGTSRHAMADADDAAVDLQALTARLKAASDYYELFGVPMTASAADIRPIYRKLVLEVHPDKGGEHEIFTLVQTAWETLSDDAQRELYDVGVVAARLAKAQARMAAQQAAEALERAFPARDMDAEIEARRAAIRAAQAQQDAILTRMGSTPLATDAGAQGMPSAPGMLYTFASVGASAPTSSYQPPPSFARLRKHDVLSATSLHHLSADAKTHAAVLHSGTAMARPEA